MKEINRKVFIKGIYDGIPIALGYFAVSFSLGITAQNAGLTPIQAMIASLLCNASAGEYAGFTSIATKATYMEIAIITMIANLRYLLMSFAMSQKFSPKTKLLHRLIIGFDLTDEIFGISMSQKGFLNPVYVYGAMLFSIPGWAIGTGIGALAGNLLPPNVVSALSVALYGMFLAIIIPPCRKDKIIAPVIAVCFVLSYLSSILPVISNLSEGTRIIILTVLISSVAAIIFPKDTEEGDYENEE
ncbi:MAG: AzlC family ABC transporter permease [Ruminococcaceae bacterium]|nr:AzlC family ABC transporter permease [Oscillospiraceae bacterium]